MIMLQGYISEIAHVQQSGILFIHFNTDGKAGIPLAFLYISRCISLININDLSMAVEATYYTKEKKI